MLENNNYRKERERESLFYFELKHKSEFTEIDKTKKRKTVGNYKPISTFSS